MEVDPIKRYGELKQEMDVIYPAMLSEVCRQYRDEGKSPSVLADAAGVNVLTIHRWLKEAKVPLRGRGRPRRKVEPAPEPGAAPVTLAPRFMWVDQEHIQVTVGINSAVIDKERLNWSGNRELGQLLISGKDSTLIEHFERFIHGNH